MTKFNAIQFAAGFTCDVYGEIDDLDELINKKDAKETKRQYNHINSLLTGIRYVMDYLEDEETKEELYALVDQMYESLDCRKASAASVVWSAELGKEVRVVRGSKMPNKEYMYELTIDGESICRMSYLDVKAAYENVKAGER